MATISSIADGNKSSGDTWNGGVPPGAADVADCDHNITWDTSSAVQQIDVATGKTATQAAGQNITGMTASCLGAGNLVMGAGCTFSFNSASALDTGALNVTANGTQANPCIVTNAGAGTATLGTGSWNLEWTQVPKSGSIATGQAVTVTIRAVNCAFAAGAAGKYWEIKASGALIFIGNTIDGFTNAEGILFGYAGGSAGTTAHISNNAFGVTSANAIDVNLTGAAGLLYLRNVRLNSPTQIGFYVSAGFGRVAIDNLGYAKPLTVAAGTRGVWYTATAWWSAQRSTANPYGTETYCALLTPKTGIGGYENRYGDIEFQVPVQTGDNISVVTHARRNGLSADCGDLIIDPEGAWFTPTTQATALVDDATWYEVTASANGAAGTAEKGAVRVVLRCKEYNNTDTMQWGGVTIDCGGVRYVVSMQEGHMGMPVVSEPDYPAEEDVEDTVEYDYAYLTGTLSAGGGAVPGAFENGAWR